MRLLASALRHARLLTGERDGELPTLSSADSTGAAAGSRDKSAARQQAERTGIKRLQRRLRSYREESGLQDDGAAALPSDSLRRILGERDDAKYSTALACLHALEKIHDALRQSSSATAESSKSQTKKLLAESKQQGDLLSAPDLGMQDAKTIRTLLSIASAWGLDFLSDIYDHAHAQISALLSTDGADRTLHKRLFVQKSNPPRAVLRSDGRELSRDDGQRLLSSKTAGPAKIAEVDSSLDPAVDGDRWAGLCVLCSASGLGVLQRVGQIVGLAQRPAPAAKQGSKPATPPPVAYALQPSTELAAVLLEVAAGSTLRLAFRLAYGFQFDVDKLALPEIGVSWQRLATIVIQAHLYSLPTTQSFQALSAVTSQLRGTAPTSAAAQGGSAQTKVIDELADSETPSSHGSPTPAPIIAQATRFLSAQLLRPDGVQSFLLIMLKGWSEYDPSTSSSGPAEDVPQGRRLDSITTLLATPPRGMPMGVYARIAVPQLLDIVGAFSPFTSSRPPAALSALHGTTACAALARIVDADLVACEEKLKELMCFPFCAAQDPHSTQAHAQLDVTRSAGLLIALIELAAPSPSFFDRLLLPHFAMLVSLLGHLRSERRPAISTNGARLDELQKRLRSALQKCARIADADLLVRALGFGSPAGSRGLLSDSFEEASLQGQRGAWRWTYNAAGEPGADFTPQEEAGQDDEVLAKLLGKLDTTISLKEARDEDAQLAGELQTLQSLSPAAADDILPLAQRAEVALGLTLDILDRLVADAQVQTDAAQNLSATSRKVLRLTLAGRLISEHADKLAVEHSERLLVFITSALDLDVESAPEEPAPLMREAEQDSEKDTVAELLKGGVVPVALTLLGHILTRTPTMIDRHALLMRTIAHKVRRIANSQVADHTHQLCTSVLLLIEARSASSSSKSGTNKTSSSDQTAADKGAAQYQEALEMLADDSVPVRAYGLVLLKELVETLEVGKSPASKKDLVVDQSKLPKILDLMILSLRDDDSYVYMNAAKGLAKFGLLRDSSMLQRLVSLYATGRDSAWEGADGEAGQSATIDQRLRIGEALQLIMQELGEALSSKMNVLVPPLRSFLLEATTPITFRVSAISLLGTAIEACPQAVAELGLGVQLGETALDILQVETRDPRSMDRSEIEPELADDPTSTDSSLPSLRRAAMLLLQLLVDQTGQQLESVLDEQEEAQGIRIEDQTEGLQALRLPGGGTLPSISPVSGVSAARPRITPAVPRLLLAPQLLPRIKTICGYVRQVDQDEVVHQQAQRCLLEIERLEISMVQAGVALSAK